MYIQSAKIPLSTSSIYIDVGLSHNAPQSTRWLTDNPNVYVFGFEPNIDAINILEQRRKNNAVLSRLHLIPVALGDVEVPTTATFYRTLHDCSTSSLYTPIVKELGPLKDTCTVPLYSLSHFFDHFPWNRFPIVNYLKVDAQGSDLAILRGGGKYLRERVVYVTAEPDGAQYADCIGNTESAICDYMIGQNFMRVKHPMTADPTFLNNDYAHLRDTYIYQYS